MRQSTQQPVMPLRLVCPGAAAARIRRLSGAVLACHAPDQGVRARPGPCNRSVPQPGSQVAASGARAGAAAEEGGRSCPVGWVTFKRCGCRDPRAGRQLPQRCPHLRERGHGSWYLAVELSAAPDAGVGGSGWAATPPVLPHRRHLAGWANRAARRAAAWPAARRGSGWRPGWQARQSLRPLTRRSYQHHLDTYLLPCIGNIPLAMLTAADLRVMFTAIARQRPAAGGPVTGDPGADPRHAAGGA